MVRRPDEDDGERRAAALLMTGRTVTSGTNESKKKRAPTEQQRFSAEVALEHLLGTSGFLKVEDCVAKIREQFPETTEDFDRVRFAYWVKKEKDKLITSREDKQPIFSVDAFSPLNASGKRHARMSPASHDLAGSESPAGTPLGRSRAPMNVDATCVCVSREQSYYLIYF
jgi:hypothetical protein